MIKKFSKLLFVNTNFYIKTAKGFEKYSVLPMKDLDLDFFLFRNKIGFWAIADGITGCRITKFHKTPILAKKQFAQQVGHQSANQIQNKFYCL